MQRLVVVGLLIVVAGAAGLGTTTATQPERALLPPDGTNLSTDSKLIRIQLRPDGTAVWEVQYRIELEDEDTTSSFESVKDDIESDPLQYSGPFAQTMGEAAGVAEDDTGREMEIQNVSVRARKLPNGFGVVTYRFEWAGFAAVNEGRLEAGDAIVGLFLDSEESTLLIEWSGPLVVDDVTPEPDERREQSVVWNGPIEFASDQPQLVLTGASTGLSLPLLGLVAGGAVLAVAGVGGLWYLRLRGDPYTPSDDDPTAAADTAGEGDEPSKSDDDTADPTPASTEPPPELLSDEERVLQLLEDNGGRMKQQEVVEAMEWSETKTSQVVKEMREEETIEVFRIGRENVLSLPGEIDV